jgi:protein-disulfide isomerase
MARKPIKRKVDRDQERAVNWKVIVGIVVGAVIFLGILMVMSLNEPDSSDQQVEQTGLIAYCEENPENCVFEGSETAPVTLLEVFDFACVHCRNFNLEGLPVFKSQYKDSGQVRFVTYPFASRPETLPATNASLCANEQGAYSEYNSALFRQFGEPGYLTNAQLLATAVSINLDRDQFAACMEEGRYNLVISDNVGYAHSIGVTSTPNFFINDTQVTGNQPQLIQQRIEAALAN